MIHGKPFDTGRGQNMKGGCWRVLLHCISWFMLAFESRIIRGDAYNNNVKYRCVVACFERGASNVIDSFFHSHRYHRFCRGSGGAQMR